MNRGKTQDRIDLELSKTYFGGNQKKDPSASGSFRKNRFVKFLFFILVPSILVLGAALFFVVARSGDKKITFSVKVDIDDPKTATEKKTQTIKTDILSFVTIKQKISRPIPTSNDLKKETTLYDFENGDEGWGVPAWAVDKPDHVAEYIEKIDGISTKGTGSLGIYAEFPGNTWSGALIEIPQFLDLKDYDVISADIYLPPEAPRGLRAKLILTVGEAWKFTEMSRAIRLTPGKWTSVTAALTDDSADWKRTKVTEAFRRDVRKIAIRIESNKPAYSGPVIVDNVRVGAYK